MCRAEVAAKGLHRVTLKMAETDGPSPVSSASLSSAAVPCCASERTPEVARQEGESTCDPAGTSALRLRIYSASSPRTDRARGPRPCNKWYGSLFPFLRGSVPYILAIFRSGQPRTGCRKRAGFEGPVTDLALPDVSKGRLLNRSKDTRPTRSTLLFLHLRLTCDSYNYHVLKIIRFIESKKWLKDRKNTEKYHFLTSISFMETSR